MGWFDSQIRQRNQYDEALFNESFIKMASAVMGNYEYEKFKDSKEVSKNAIGQILKFYHITAREIPESITGFEEQLDYAMRPNGVMTRRVNLVEDWYKNAIGPYLAVKKDDDEVVALLPSKGIGYYYIDRTCGKKKKINSRNCTEFETEAICFYKPFPLRKLEVADLFKYGLNCLDISDFVFVALGTLITTCIGLITPKLMQLLMSNVTQNTGTPAGLLSIMVFLVCASISGMLFGSVTGVLTSRLTQKMSLNVNAAVIMRIMSLPATFFKDYSSGELYTRSEYISSLCTMMVNSVLTIGLSSLFSLMYIGQIMTFAPSLVWPAIGVIVMTLLVSVISTLLGIRVSRQTMKLSSKESGLSYALINGVQKIKLAGAERRAFAKWVDIFSKESELTYNPPIFLKLSNVVILLISTIGTGVIYYEAIINHVSVADYYAFNASYGMVSGAFLSLSAIAATIATAKPIIEMIKPILDTAPEESEEKQPITRLSGTVEINHLSFRYNDDSPMIIDDLSLAISSGEYVGIVGKTGCGKSTLIRLLLGFEKPMKGSIYYDKKEINTIDLKSLRRKIGVCLQNGSLFQGDIYSNIVISAPWLSVDAAWEAAELADIADDIRKMPMGMNTIIGEGSGGISGGQKQRLMIARAVAPKPRLLILDEATSALDNLTQKKVSEALDKLKCTRIVIAHRLSTIKQCDRIIVLDGGKIIEQGTYDELMSQNGFFTELVKHQQIDFNSED